MFSESSVVLIQTKLLIQISWLSCISRSSITQIMIVMPDFLCVAYAQKIENIKTLEYNGKKQEVCVYFSYKTQHKMAEIRGLYVNVS